MAENRMKFLRKICLSALPALLYSIMMPAQDLPQLRTAQEIRKGRLDCGVEYFIVENKTVSGQAEVAVVQPYGGIVETARLSLSSLPHSGGEAPYKFLAGKGIGYRQEGLAQYLGIPRYHTLTLDDPYNADAQPTYGKSLTPTVFRFKDVPVGDEAAVDTTLLFAFDIVSSNPYAQALIVSGDIDRSKVLSKIELLSMMVAPRQRIPETPAYQWHKTDTMRVLRRPCGGPSGFVSASYASPRTPRPYMGTAQPLVSRMFAEELGLIVKARTARKLSALGIPVTDISAEYVGSGQAFGDETYTFTIGTDTSMLCTALEALAGTLAELDVHGAAVEEYRDAKMQFLSGVTKASQRQVRDNEEYVNQCIAAYLHGSDLASPKTVGDFFLSRNIDPSREVSLFNNFVSALLDRKANLTLTTCGGSLQSPRAAFIEAWQKKALDTNPPTGATSYSDTLGLVSTTSKSKIKGTEAEPVTGGELWTFSNGVRVVYKQTESPEDGFSYALQIRGGTSSIKGLQNGQAGFVGDVVGLCSVGGLTGVGFRDMLGANGITMDIAVSLSDLRVTGSAPSSKLPLLMRALVSLANEGSLEQRAYEEYRTAERLRLSLPNQRTARARLEDMLVPGYQFSGSRFASALTDDLPQVVDRYLRSQFANVNDGIIVLVGDLDAETVKKTLTKTVGSLRTGRRSTVRPIVDYTPRTGISTETVTPQDGELPRAEVQVLSMLPFTAENYASALVATMVLRHHLVELMADYGMSVDVDWDFASIPKEALSVWFSLTPCDPDGLPYIGVQQDLGFALRASRQVFGKAAESLIPASELVACKATAKTFFESLSTDPEAAVGSVLLRYADGKDITTHWQETLDAIDSGHVQAIFRALADGSRAEWVVDGED